MILALSFWNLGTSVKSSKTGTFDGRPRVPLAKIKKVCYYVNRPKACTVMVSYVTNNRFVRSLYEQNIK